MGKAYAHKKSIKERPKGDFYETPKSLVWVAKDIICSEFNSTISILEPCSGNGSIANELKKLGFHVVENDLFNQGVDYLTNEFTYKYIITNPPFSLWDEFATKAKSECEKVMLIGRLNYFGTASRLKNKIWENLKSVYCFNRYVDYRTPSREDGFFNVGAMATAWFLWDASFHELPTVQFLDIQKYAKLGNWK
jgi:hypothetical protein